MNHYFKRIILLVAAIVFLFSTSVAQSDSTNNWPQGLQLMIAGALEFGGESVADILFTNGQTIDMPAGQGGTIAAGANWNFPKYDQFSLRASVGIKYLTTPAENANIRLTRVPLVLTAGWSPVRHFRIAAGVSSHQAIKFRADGIGEDFDFNPAVAPTFEITYRNIGLVYTPMTYTDEDGESYKANAFGVTAAYLFAPRKR